MATGGSGSSDADSSVTVNKLTCAICLDTYRRPKLLACFHSFCQSCLQGVAGPSPTFHCPSCRTLILLPPGGVAALQTNFYIEEELDDTSSPPRRLCDVCTDDREATHTCMQCQQKLCLPCRKVHDALRLSRGHTVVSLTQDQEGACGDGSSDKGEDQQKTEMCPKHPDQRLLLHCNKCQAALCMQCKLTQHEGHPTDDLANTRAKVKVKLQDMLGELCQEIEQRDQLLVAVEDRRTQLQQHQQTTEQDFKSRADTLFQWVNQALDEALTSVQASTKLMEKTLEDQAEQLRNKNSTLQAQRDHLMHVLKDGKEADFVSLEAQLSSSTSDNVDVTQTEKELTKDIPKFHVKHNITAVNQLQLRAFVGVLEPVQQTSCPKETCNPMLSGSVPTEGSASMGRTGKPSAADRSVGVRQKKAPREFVYSQNPEAVVLAMCSISHSRFWVLYFDKGTRSLKLFDAEGQVLTAAENVGRIRSLSAICDDMALAWSGGRQQTAQLIRPDGSMTSYDMGTSFYALTSTTTNDDHYLATTTDDKLHRVKFTLAKKDQPDSRELRYGTTLSKPAGKPHFSSQVTHSRLEVVFDQSPPGLWPQHVSAGGRYFAFIEGPKVTVYTKAGRRGSRLLSSYRRQGLYPADVRFCQMDGQELLMVAVPDDHKVHVVDHTDDCRFVRYLDTGTLNLYRPCYLTPDCDHHLMIGCDGGKVVIVDL